MSAKVTKASRGASRSSIMAIQPNNPELTIMRRQRLVDAFAQLTPDEQADFLEEAETVAMRRGEILRYEDSDLRAHIHRLLDRAGLT